MRLSLPYGRATIEVELPSSCAVETIAPPSRLAVKDPAAALIDALSRPVAGPSLRDIVTPGMTVAIVVADWTRACDYPTLLPVLLDELNRCGVRDESVSLLVAYGTHARQPDDSSREHYGAGVFSRVEIVHHDCDAADLVPVGRTSRGTDVRLNRAYLNADAAITLGAVTFHYFAGFGGGPKLVFPGLASRAGTQANHALYVEQMAERPRRFKATIDGNACAEDIRDAAALAPPTLSVHCLFNERRALAHVIAGEWRASHEAACTRLRETAMMEVARPYDVVVASCGGLPHDINLIQAHKSIDNACELLRDGGTLVIAAECGEGVGSDTLLGWFDLDENAFIKSLRDNYALHGGTALAMRRKTRRWRVYMKTALPQDVVRHAGLIAATDVQACLDEVLAVNAGARIAYLPSAAETVACERPSD